MGRQNGPRVWVGDGEDRLTKRERTNVQRSESGSQISNELRIAILGFTISKLNQIPTLA